MSKRFTDTDKYKKAFIRGLPGAYKLLWDYLYHDCDHAGVWHKDFEIAQIYLGNDMLVNEKTALELFNKDQERIKLLDNGTKWLILPFIGFQYGELNPENRAHSAVIKVLRKAGIKVLESPLQGRKDMDKDKEKDKDKNPIFDFEKVWERYPNKDGKKAAQKHFEVSVKTEADFSDISKALENYLSSDRVCKGFVKNGATWFNNWRDWIIPPMARKEEIPDWRIAQTPLKK